MVGRVNKAGMYDRWRYFRYIPDWRSLSLFLRVMRRDKRPQAILGAVMDELQSAGIKLVDSTQYCGEHLSTVGVMTRRQPTEQQWADIKFGYEICRNISRMDIGQSIGVIDRDVIAVEAVEGTNAMIERAGKLCRVGGWTLIKVSNTNQDMRVDVPTVGLVTIEKLAAARAGCLVLEAGKTMLLEKAKVLELADRHRIAVVGWNGDPTRRRDAGYIASGGLSDARPRAGSCLPSSATPPEPGRFKLKFPSRQRSKMSWHR